MRYRLKNKYFNGVPANEIRTTSPVACMTDEQWKALVAKWSDPKKHGMGIFSYILSHSVSKGSSHFKHIISSILLAIPRPFNEKQCNT